MSKRSNTSFLFGRLNYQQFFINLECMVFVYINTMKTSFNFYDDIYNGPGFGCTKGRSSHHRFRRNISIFSWELRLGRSCFIFSVQRLKLALTYNACSRYLPIFMLLKLRNQLQLHCNR